MKSLIILFCFILFACASDTNKIDRDEFFFHIHYLDSVINTNPFDTTCKSSIEFLENTTKIKAHGDGTFVGYIFFNKEDLRKWKEWGENNNW
ncbi:MAG: hypothetical protein KF763_01380 [Cyclobacteriaceae bacterium]|nr:hypothetical protein [Cyclobacteriaceae bacterium]